MGKTFTLERYIGHKSLEETEAGEEGPPAALGRRDTNAKPSDFLASHTNECHQAVVTNASEGHEVCASRRRKRSGLCPSATGGWRTLHNEELHNLYSSPSIIRIIKSRRKWAGHVARMAKKRNVYRLTVGKPERKRPLGRPRRRWMDNIKMGPLEIGLSVVDWIGLAQDR
jgi:hypothetical protein